MTFNYESRTESYPCESLNCAAFEDRVQQILDERLTLTGDAPLMEHAAQCSQCEIKLYDYDSFDDSISFLKQNFADVPRMVDVDGSSGAFSHSLFGLAGLAAALLIFLNIFGWATTNHSDGFARLTETEATAQPINSSAMSRLAVAQPAAAPKLRFVSKSYRVTPDTSPFSPNFRVADNLPRLPAAPDWETVSLPLETLMPVLNYSTELPAINSFHCALNVTFELLRRSLSENPDSELKLELG